MIIGTLLEVMCLNEDALRANRRRVINLHNKMGSVFGVTAETQKEAMNKAMQTMKPKEREKFKQNYETEINNKLKSGTDTALAAMRQSIKDKRAGVTTDQTPTNDVTADYLKNLSRQMGVKRTDPKFREKILNQLKTQSFSSKLPASLGGAAFPGTNVFFGNKNAVLPNPIVKNGKIDWKSPATNHEIQHLEQGKVGKAVAKAYGLPENSVNKNWMNQYADLGKVTMGDPTETAKYQSDPFEYEANKAGAAGQAKPTINTVRLAKQMIGKSQNNYRPTVAQGASANQKTLVGKGLSADDLKLVNQMAKDGGNDFGHKPEHNKVSKAEYGQEQKILSSVKPYQSKFDLNTLDATKGFSSNPVVNKSKNNFVKIRDNNGRTFTVPDTDPRYQQMLRAQQQPQPVAQQSQPVQQRAVRPNMNIINRLRYLNNNQQAASQQFIQRRPIQQQIIQRSVQPRPAMQQQMIPNNGVADRNTGIVYAKKNGKLVSNMMTASQQK